MSKLIQGAGDEGAETPELPSPVPPATVLSVTGHPMLGSCDCGSDTFILVNELRDAQAPGFRSSLMYECVTCGKYRLAK